MMKYTSSSTRQKPAELQPMMHRVLRCLFELCTEYYAVVCTNHTFRVELHYIRLECHHQNMNQASRDR